MPSPYPWRITTEHMKTSMGRMPSSGTLPFPVVWKRPMMLRRCSSEMASGSAHCQSFHGGSHPLLTINLVAKD